MTLNIAPLFRGGERQRRIRAHSLQKRRRRVEPLLEQCEPRQLLSTVPWDNGQTFRLLPIGRSYAASVSTSIGQAVRMEVRLDPDADGPPDNVDFSSGGGNRKLTDANPSASIPTFFSGGGTEQFSIRWNSGYDDGDAVAVTVYKQRLANLVALVPTLNPDGSVSYGYKIDGDVPVIYRDYVEVELFYASGPSKSQILDYAGAAVKDPRPIARHNLESNPGAPAPFNVAADWFQKNPPPPNTTHLVVIIDRKNKAAEYNESDSDNVKAIALPNIVALAPKLYADGSAGVGYRVNSRDFVTDQKITVQAWYSRTERWEDRIAVAAPGDPNAVGALFRAEMSPGQRKDKFETVPASLLANAPADAKYLLTRVDNADLARESNEKDNVAATPLPDLAITEMSWTSQGDVKVAFTMSRLSGWPKSVRPRLTLWWSNDPNSTSSASPAVVDDLKLSEKPGAQTYSAGELGRSWRGEKYLIATLAPDPRYVDPVANHRRVLVAADVAGAVSSELYTFVDGQPGKAHPRIIVAGWLADHRRAIERAASDYRVPKEAIAAAVAYEALRNIQNGQLRPGKLDPYGYDAFAVEGAAQYRRGVLPQRTTEDRAAATLDPATSIRYIGAIMNAYAMEAKWAGFNIRKDTALLTSLYLGLLPNGQRGSRVGVQSGLPDQEISAVGYLAADFLDDWIGNILHHGTGSLISPRYVLTAAHNYFAPKDAGGNPTAYSMDPGPDASHFTLPSAITVDVAKVSPHKNYSKRDFQLGDGTSTVDLAIVTLRSAINDVRPLQLLTGAVNVGEQVDFYGAQLKNIGIGNTTKMIIVSGKNDISSVQNTTFQWLVDDSLPYERDSIDGESGGPIMVTRAGKRYLAGTIWGGDRHLSPRLSYNAKLDLAWIDKTIGTDVAASGWITLGEAGFYFRHQKQLKRSVKPQANVGDWVKGNLEFLRDALAKPGPATAAATLRGDLDDSFELDIQDRALFDQVVAGWSGLSNTARSRMLNLSDLNDDGMLDARDGKLLDDLIRLESPLNDPVAVDDSANTAGGKAVVLKPLANDVAPAGKMLTIVDFDKPSNGKVAFDPASPTSRLIYTPKSGFKGVDSFRYVISDDRGFQSVGRIEIRVGDQAPAAPANLRADNVWPRTIDLKWDDRSNNETEFRVTISRDNGKTWSKVGVLAANATSLRVEGLEPLTHYLFKVRAGNSAGYSDFSNTLDATTGDDAPANLRVDNAHAYSVDLKWDDRSGNETEFRVAISRDGGATWDNVATAPANAAGVRVDGLAPSTRYLFKVRATIPGGYTGYSNILDATTKAPPVQVPAAPANLRADNVWAETIDLKWDDRSGNETEFRVAISRDGGATWDNIGVVGPNVTSIRVPNLQPSTRYLFMVRAGNSAGYSDYSNILDATTKAPPVQIPAAPANLRADNVWPRTIDLKWDDRSGNETEFRIAMSRDGGATWNNVGVVGANVTTFRIANLDAATRYLFMVRAGNSAGYSDYSNILDATTGDDAPTNLRLDNVHAYSVDLRWDDRSGDETEFRVAISRDGGATWDNVAATAANAVNVRVDNLAPSTRYLFKVRATIPGGYTGYSNIVDATTQAPPVQVPTVPANLRADNIWAEKIDLKWDDRSGNETEFRVAISRDGGATWDNVAVVGANVTSFRVTGLKPSTRYLFKVRAGNSAGYSDYSNIIDLRTRA